MSSSTGNISNPLSNPNVTSVAIQVNNSATSAQQTDQAQQAVDAEIAKQRLDDEILDQENLDASTKSLTNKVPPPPPFQVVDPNNAIKPKTNAHARKNLDNMV